MLSVRAAAPRARVPHVFASAILDVRVAAMDFRAAMMRTAMAPAPARVMLHHRSFFSALVMCVAVFLEDGEDGRSAGTLSCGDDGWSDMTAQDGCFY